MAAKDTMKSSMPPRKPRLNNAERRAVEGAANAGKQAQLKREAAERRAERARREADALPRPEKAVVKRRSHSH